jgi:Domain of unknown function (DUF5615)
MAFLYTNENFPQPAVAELRRRGHNVLTTHDAGKSNVAISDDAVVDYAHSKGRVVVTLNRRDFIKLHKAGVAHSGIVVCTVDADYIALAARVDAAITDRKLVGELIRVERGNSRPSVAPNTVGVALRD